MIPYREKPKEIVPADNNLRVSYSSLNTFSGCPRKFEFSKLYPRRVFDGDMHAADVGSALHAGYQEYLVSRDEDKAIWALLCAYPWDSEGNQHNDDRSHDAVITTLIHMMQAEDMNEWVVAEIVNHEGNVVPAIEVPFEIVLEGITLADGRGVAVVGFIDAILRNMFTERFRTMDIKTHRSTLKDVDPKYRFDSQQVPYGIVLEHVLDRVIDSFEVLYYDTFVDLVEPRVQMLAYTKTKQDVNDWLVNTVIKCQQIQRFTEMDFFPRTDNGCLSYNRPCYYLDICESRSKPEIEQWLLMGDDAEVKTFPEPWIRTSLNPFAQES